MREEVALFLLLLVIVSLIFVFYNMPHHTTEGFTIHTDFLDRQNKQFNNIGLSLGIKRNNGILGKSANDLLNTFQFPGDTPLNAKREGLWASIDKCESVKTMDCGAFDDPEFEKICGICLDIGKNSDSVPATGGMVLLSEDKNLAKESASSNYLPNYTPTLGFCPAGKMVSTKAECLKLQRQLLCRKNSSYSLEGCSQCYSDTTYSIVDPKTSPGVVTGSGHILVVGKGILNIEEQGFPAKAGIKLHETNPYKVNVKGKEATRIRFRIKPAPASDDEDPDIPYISGLLNGDTGSGIFSSDLRRIVMVDEVTGRKPRSHGKDTIDNVTVTKMAPGFEKETATIVVIVPFTFVETTMEESSMCKDGPFVTTQASAEFLESDPCYKKGSGPGKFSLECLQGIWDDNGCNGSGKGYPRDATVAATLMAAKDGSFLPLNNIADFIYNKALITSTGVDENGKTQPMKDWSEASVFCTGRMITSPCDTPDKNRGPLSPECIIHLWNNQSSKKTWQGMDDPIGPTYHPSNAVSLFKQGTVERSCQTTGTMSPIDPNGKKNRDAIKYWQRQGGVDNVKRVMTDLHRAANAQVVADDKLAPYFQQCYGNIPFAARPPTVFKIPNNMLPSTYNITRNTVLVQSLTMTQDYKLQFVITPRSIQGGWSNIIHLTATDTDWCAGGAGCRSPAIWFWPGSLQLHVMIGASDNWNWGINVPGCELNRESSFSLECRGNSVRVTLDGKVHSATHPNWRYSGNVKVYGSNPWYVPAIAEIKDVGLQLFGNSIDTLPAWIKTMRDMKLTDAIGYVTTNTTFDLDGTAFGVHHGGPMNGGGTVFRSKNIQTGDWEQFPTGRLVQIGLAYGMGAFRLMGVGTDGNLYRTSGNPGNPDWRLNGPDTRNKLWSTGGINGLNFHLTKDGNIWLGNMGFGDGAKYWQIPGSLAMISYGSSPVNWGNRAGIPEYSELWGVNSGGNIYRYNGTAKQIHERVAEGKQNGTDWQQMPTPTEPPGLDSGWATYVAVSPNSGNRIVAIGKRRHKLGYAYAWHEGKWIPVVGESGPIAICDSMVISHHLNAGKYYKELPPG